jgi:hypothetical protein
MEGCVAWEQSTEEPQSVFFLQTKTESAKERPFTAPTCLTRVGREQSDLSLPCVIATAAVDQIICTSYNTRCSAYMHQGRAICVHEHSIYIYIM